MANLRSGLLTLTLSITHFLQLPVTSAAEADDRDGGGSTAGFSEADVLVLTEANFTDTVERHPRVLVCHSLALLYVYWSWSSMERVARLPFALLGTL